MEAEEIEARKRRIEEEFGPWTATDIDLGHGIFTRSAQPPASAVSAVRFMHQKHDWSGYSPTSSRVLRVAQIVQDLSGKPLHELRVLDLASMEGAFAIELGARGATVVGVEGRRGHIAKAELARDARGLANVTFALDDVRNVTAARYGTFDVVLCLGILYHLPAPDVFTFIDAITDCCTRLLIVDTEVAPEGSETKEHRGHRYYGVHVPEHAASSSRDEIEENAWMSTGNANSFVLTRFSLYNVFADLGFSSAYECFEPPVVGHGARTTFAVVKGERWKLQTASRVAEERERYSEAGSGRRDSELHLVRSELDRLRANPLAAILSFARRGVRKLLRR